MITKTHIPVLRIAASLMVLFSATPAQAEAKHFKVLLIGGPSNIFGYGTAPTSLPAELHHLDGGQHPARQRFAQPAHTGTGVRFNSKLTLN